MTITLFGILVLLIGGVIMVRGSTLTMLNFVMLTTLMGGSAAFYLATGSSILPSIAAVMLLAIRCLMPTQRPTYAIRSALNANLPLVLFTIYGAVGAFILPFIFAGSIDVVPLRPIFTPDPFATTPLVFTSQNITSAGYLVATALAAICAFVAVQAQGSEFRIARVAAIIAIIHASLGFASVIFSGTAIVVVFEFFRNALYNQLDQDVGGLSRMTGIFAEASNFAGYGLVYFVFVTELWLRGLDRRWTGPAALILLSALVVSTSTTGYIGIAGYVAILVMRQVIFPATISSPNLIIIAVCGFILTTTILVVAAGRPEFLELVELVYRIMVVNKSDSQSGMVRLMWARQGIEAFWVSGGLGVGVGSFRSSSLGTAILGAMGVIGVVAYAAQILRVLQPLRESTFKRTGNPRVDVGVAASWTVIAMSIPAFVSAPSPDPGLNWGIMVGIALGLRRQTELRDSARPAFHRVGASSRHLLSSDY